MRYRTLLFSRTQNRLAIRSPTKTFPLIGIFSVQLVEGKARTHSRGVGRIHWGIVFSWSFGSALGRGISHSDGAGESRLGSQYALAGFDNQKITRQISYGFA